MKYLKSARSFNIYGLRIFIEVQYGPKNIDRSLHPLYIKWNISGLHKNLIYVGPMQVNRKFASSNIALMKRTLVKWTSRKNLQYIDSHNTWNFNRRQSSIRNCLLLKSLRITRHSLSRLVPSSTYRTKLALIENL